MYGYSHEATVKMLGGIIIDEKRYYCVRTRIGKNGIITGCIVKTLVTYCKPKSFFYGGIHHDEIYDWYDSLEEAKENLAKI